MNEELFLLRLTSKLVELDIVEISTIVAEYEALFQDAKENGLTDEEIIQQLGHPHTIAVEYSRGQLGNSQKRREHVEGKRRGGIWTLIGFVFVSLSFIIPAYLILVSLTFTVVSLNIVFILLPVPVFISYAILQAELFEVFFAILLSGIGLIILPFIPNLLRLVIKPAIGYVRLCKRIFRGYVR